MLYGWGVPVAAGAENGAGGVEFGVGGLAERGTSVGAMAPMFICRANSMARSLAILISPSEAERPHYTPINQAILEREKRTYLATVRVLCKRWKSAGNICCETAVGTVMKHGSHSE